ncbi:hypothetical protein BDR03DRAFT_728905 [Suillus americanus]|nr:hypothetical protein BDR03DRAFT_728905 [Suillus americanus]
MTVDGRLYFATEKMQKFAGFYLVRGIAGVCVLARYACSTSLVRPALAVNYGARVVRDPDILRVLQSVRSVYFVTLLNVQLAYLASTILNLGTGNDNKMRIAHASNVASPTAV